MVSVEVICTVALSPDLSVIVIAPDVTPEPPFNDATTVAFVNFGSKSFANVSDPVRVKSELVLVPTAISNLSELPR